MFASSERSLIETSTRRIHKLNTPNTINKEFIQKKWNGTHSRVPPVEDELMDVSGRRVEEKVTPFVEADL